MRISFLVTRIVVVILSLYWVFPSYTDFFGLVTWKLPFFLFGSVALIDVVCAGRKRFQQRQFICKNLRNNALVVATLIASAHLVFLIGAGLHKFTSADINLLEIIDIVIYSWLQFGLSLLYTAVSLHWFKRNDT